MCKFCYFILLPFLAPLAVGAQDGAESPAWGMADVIRMACTSSPDAKAARHTFRAAYWDYRSFVADYRPSLTLTTDPYFNRSINSVTMEDGSIKYREQNYLTTDLSLNLSQRVAFTGGTVSLSSSLSRMDMLGDKSHSWRSAPVNLTYSQSLFGYNSYKWQRRQEPLRYNQAQRAYVETMELVAVQAISRFFSLVTAKSNYQSACQNYANADTLYRFAQGRYEIGTITENEMLQLGVNRLNEEANRMDAEIALQESELSLRSYLGLSDTDPLPEIRMDNAVPDFVIDEGHALQLARANSPDMLSLQQRLLSAESSVASAKADAGLKADIYLRFGLTQTGERFSDAYHRPLDQQTASIGLTLPILDWGRGRGRVRVARSQRDLVQTQVEQSRVDFDQNVRKLVSQFNLQAMRVRVAARKDSTAQRRSEVARRLYLLGRSTVLDLNASISEKDSARRGYLSALREYWSLYYTLRSITLFDFRRNEPLSIDEKLLIED